MERVEFKDILDEINREGLESLKFMSKMKKKTFHVKMEQKQSMNILSFLIQKNSCS